jgi:hypothetical protein
VAGIPLIGVFSELDLIQIWIEHCHLSFAKLRFLRASSSFGIT